MFLNTMPSALPVFNNALKEEKAIVFLAVDEEDEFVTKLESYIRDAAQTAGYHLDRYNSRNSAEIQIAQVKKARDRGEKAIIINLVDPDSVPSILDAAGDMKVVFINRPPSDLSALNNKAVYIGPDETVAGKLQGEWLANYFKDTGENSIRYILLMGPENLPAPQQRAESVLQALEQNGINAIEVAPPIVANFSRREAMDKMIPVLRSGVNFDAIIANNAAMAIGAIQAFEYLNMDPAGKVIVSIDATQPAIRAILEGKLDMTVFQNAMAQAEISVAVIENMLNGNPFNQGITYPISQSNPNIIWVPLEPVTRFNIPKSLYF